MMKRRIVWCACWVVTVKEEDLDEGTVSKDRRLSQTTPVVLRSETYVALRGGQTILCTSSFLSSYFVICDL